MTVGPKLSLLVLLTSLSGCLFEALSGGGSYGEPVHVGWVAKNETSYRIDMSFTVNQLDGKEVWMREGSVPANQILLSSGSDLPAGTYKVQARATSTASGFEQTIDAHSLDIDEEGSLLIVFSVSRPRIEFDPDSSNTPRPS